MLYLMTCIKGIYLYFLLYCILQMMYHVICLCYIAWYIT